MARKEDVGLKLVRAWEEAKLAYKNAADALTAHSEKHGLSKAAHQRFTRIRNQDELQQIGLLVTREGIRYG